MLKYENQLPGTVLCSSQVSGSPNGNHHADGKSGRRQNASDAEKQHFIPKELFKIQFFKRRQVPGQGIPGLLFDEAGELVQVIDQHEGDREHQQHQCDFQNLWFG